MKLAGEVLHKMIIVGIGKNKMEKLDPANQDFVKAQNERLKAEIKKMARKLTEEQKRWVKIEYNKTMKKLYKKNA